MNFTRSRTPRETVYERQKRTGFMGMGPNHPMARATPPPPQMAQKEEAPEQREAPGFGPAECCGNCMHHEGERCGKYGNQCSATDRCEGFEEGGGEEQMGEDDEE